MKYQLTLNYDEESLSYQRFVTHLKFFAQRMLTRTVVEDDDVTLHSAVRITTLKRGSVRKPSPGTCKRATSGR